MGRIAPKGELTEQKVLSSEKRRRDHYGRAEKAAKRRGILEMGKNENLGHFQEEVAQKNVHLFSGGREEE